MKTSEPVLRREKVSVGAFVQKKGWLTLTPQRLIFSKDVDPYRGVYFDVLLTEIESVRAKKAFRKGVDVLEVLYVGSTGKRQTVPLERMSWAQWANPVGRAEANSLAGFEAAIIEARREVLGPHNGAELGTNTVISQLERLADLKERGILTEEEFQRQKALLMLG